MCVTNYTERRFLLNKVVRAKRKWRVKVIVRLQLERALGFLAPTYAKLYSYWDYKKIAHRAI